MSRALIRGMACCAAHQPETSNLCSDGHFSKVETPGRLAAGAEKPRATGPEKPEQQGGGGVGAGAGEILAVANRAARAQQHLDQVGPWRRPNAQQRGSPAPASRSPGTAIRSPAGGNFSL